MNDQIIDFLPLEFCKRTNRSKLLAMLKNESIPEEKTYNSHLELLKEVAESSGQSRSTMAIEEFLNKSSRYSSWIKLMPDLSEVNSIYKYVNEYSKFNDWQALKNEIIKFGMIIPKGQCLYSGGSFETNDMQIEKLGFSTTLQPSVACIHSHSKNKDIALLKVSDYKTYGFILNKTHRHKYEREILLAGMLELKFKAVESVGEYRVFDFDLYSK